MFYLSCFLFVLAFGGIVTVIKSLVKTKNWKGSSKDLLGVVVVVGVAVWLMPASEPGEALNHQPANTQAIALVRTTQQNPPNVSARTAPLSGGVVVLYEGPVYWVSSNQVFAVNGLAKSWSPGIDYAPAEINFAAAEQAISNHYSSQVN